MRYRFATYRECKAMEMNRTIGTRLHIPTWYYNLMDHDEPRREGQDLADILLRDEGRESQGKR